LEVWAVLPDVPWYRLIAYQGLLNVVNLMLVFYVLTASLREPRDLQRLVDVLLWCVALRGLWGLFRFVALGGDPANFYENFQKINIKITFFDINDSLLAMMAVFIAAWRLAHGLVQSRSAKWAYGGLIALELFIVLFSQRRTAWGGLVLVVLLFAWLHRGRLRWGLLTGLAVIGAPVLAYKLIQRTGQSYAGGSWLERFAPDIFVNGQLSFTTGRFAELYAAWIYIRESPWVGLGAWGRYDGFRFSELAWHRGDFGWMHSGVLHIMLKTGLLGVALMLVVMGLYLRFVFRSRPAMPAAWQGVLWMGFAGALFMLPTWLIGTPVIEYRTMQLLALCLALPYLAVAAAKVSVVGNAPATSVAAARWGIRPLRLRTVGPQR
jgi:O-antigen ligase